MFALVPPLSKIAMSAGQPIGSKGFLMIAVESSEGTQTVGLKIRSPNSIDYFHH